MLRLADKSATDVAGIPFSVPPAVLMAMERSEPVAVTSGTPRMLPVSVVADAAVHVR